MAASVIYEARGVSRRFSLAGTALWALCDVSLSIHPGELVAVTGPSGCGKSTLLQVLGLLDPAYEGALTFEGADVRSLDARARAHLRLSRIGFVFQNFQLIEALSVLQNVALPRWRLLGDRGGAEAHAQGLLSRFDLAHRAAGYPGQLSVGEMQRTAVARALACEPVVIIADEPTANLDASNAERIIGALVDAAAAGRTVLVASHDPLLIHRAHRVVALDHGRLRS